MTSADRSRVSMAEMMRMHGGVGATDGGSRTARFGYCGAEVAVVCVCVVGGSLGSAGQGLAAAGSAVDRLLIGG